MNKILVHRCFDPDKETKPITCTCSERVSPATKADLLRDGLVVKVSERHLAYRVGAVAKRAPIARTISAREIAAAYAAEGIKANDAIAERIEIFGELTQESFASLGAKLRDRGVVSPQTRVMPPQVAS